MFGLKVSDILVKLKSYLIFLAVLTSCTSPLEKSILDPLTSKELDKVARKDISFLATYSIVEEKSNYISTPSDSARWREITYNRLHSYLNTIKSAELNAPLFTKLREDWENIYNRNNSKVDSIIGSWNNYLASNSPDSLLSVSFDGIETERIRNKENQIDTLIKARIRLVPKKFDIDSITVFYSFNYKDESPVYYFPFNGELNHIKHTRKLKEGTTIKVFPYLLPNLKKQLSAGDTSVVFRYEIVSLYAHGKCYNADSLYNDIPKSILQYNLAKSKENETGIFDERYFREKIIKELINPSFVSQGAYIRINAEGYYNEIDSLVFSYTNLNGAQ